MKIFKIAFIVGLLLIIFFNPATPQNTGQHELNIYSSTGVSSLSKKMNYGKKYPGLGFNFGIDYVFMFNPNWGLSCGVGYAVYNSKSNLSSFNDSYELTDHYNEDYYFNFYIFGNNEKQQAQYFNIPIMIQYHGGENLKFYVAAGSKIGIPLKGKYKTSSARIRTSAYYPKHDLTIDDLYFMGIGLYDLPNKSLDFNLKPQFFCSIEFGLKFNMKNSNHIYTSVFLDYGLNEIIKGDKRQSYLEHNSDDPTNFTVNSMLNSTYNIDKKLYVQKSAILYTGIKIIYGFQL